MSGPLSAPTRAGTSPSSIWAARRVPRAKDGGVPHVQVDLAASWWDPSSPMMCIATWVLTPVLPGAHVAEISLQCPWPLAGSEMSSCAWGHWLWCTARLMQRAQACVMCRWRLARGAVPILKAWNLYFQGIAIATICTGPEPTYSCAQEHKRAYQRIKRHTTWCFGGCCPCEPAWSCMCHGSRCMCARAGARGRPLWGG